MNLIDHIGNHVNVYTKDENRPMKNRILTAVDDKGLTFLSDPVGVVKHIETFVPWDNISQVDLIRPVAGKPCEVCGEPIGESDFVTANHAWHREDCRREVRVGDIIRVGVEQRFRNDWYGDFFPFPDSEWIVSSVSNDLYPLTLQHPTSHQLYKYLPIGENPYTIVERTDTDKREGDALTPSTAELVEMLAKREGVNVYEIATPEHAYRIQIRDLHGDGETAWWTIGPTTGPARILVMMD